MAGDRGLGFVDRFQRHRLVLVLQIGVEQHGVVTLLLRLDHVPVGKAIESLGLEIVGELEIKVCRVKFLVDLLVQQLVYRLVHNG